MEERENSSQTKKQWKILTRRGRDPVCPKMAGVDERAAFAKLEALKDIRHKTISLEKTRVSLLCDVGQMEEEERCLQVHHRSILILIIVILLLLLIIIIIILLIIIIIKQ